MKKSLWMLGAAVAALTSCTQNEVVDIAENRAIGFEPYVGKMTRAVQNINSADQINYFNVFGYHANHTNGVPEGNFSEEFNNHWVKQATGTDGNAYWMNEKAGYWDADQLFRFAAYTNGSNVEKVENATYDPVQDVLTIPGYVVTDSIASAPAEKPDLLAAISGDRITTSVSGNADVIFNFRHILTKITLVLYNNSTNMNLHYHDLSVANMYKKGDCILSYNNGTPKANWDNLDEQGTFRFGSYELSHPTEGTATHTTKLVDFYVIPQSSNLTLTFSTHQTDANGNSAMPASYSTNLSVESVAGTGKTNWLPGHHYRYNIMLGETGHVIAFDVNGIVDWVDDINGSGGTDQSDYITLNLTKTSSDN